MDRRNRVFSASLFAVEHCIVAMCIFIVVVRLHMMTLWNLDLAARQQLASLKAESGALALSVAPARLPDRDNAALIYEQTYEPFNTKSWSEDRRKKWEQWTDFDSKEFDPDDPDLKSLLDEQASTMKLLRQAGKKPGCHFERNYGFPSIDWDLSELGKLRDAARLLGLDARYRATQGDMQTALQNVDTMFKIAEHVGADPILISVLVANAIDAIATDTLQEILAAEGNLAGDERITTEQLQTIAPDGSLSFQRLCSRAFRLEIACALNTIQQLSSDPEWSGLLSTLRSGEAPPPPTQAFYRMFMATADAASYREVMGECSRIAAKPYFEAKSEWEDFHKEFETKPKGIITAMFLPAISRAVRVMAHGDARHRTARLALAAARYRAEKGELPKTLDALVPDYIPILPRDPFDGKPMKYRKTVDGAVIYSIGPDGTDDNGALWDKDAEAGDVMFELKK